MKIHQLLIAFCLSISLSAAADEGETGPSLYERLGSEPGIQKIIGKTLELHLANPVLAPYFKNLDHEWFQESAVAFFAAGTGGPNNYTGGEVADAHTHLKISSEVFDLAMGDIYASMETNGVDQATRGEVAAILESFRGVVVNE